MILRNRIKKVMTTNKCILIPQLLHRLIGSLYVGASYEFQDVRDFNYEAGGVFDQQYIFMEKRSENEFQERLKMILHEIMHTVKSWLILRSGILHLSTEKLEEYSLPTLFWMFENSFPWRTNN